MLSKKGVSTAVLLLLALVIIVPVAILGYYAFTLAVRPVHVPVDYDGEFKEGFLATKGWFYSDFKEYKDCNVTSDVLGADWGDGCIYRTITKWNATNSSAINSKDWVLSLVVDIDNPVEKMNIDIDTGGGTQSTGKPEDDCSLTTLKLYTHEDDPAELYDFKGSIDDQQDVDMDTGALDGDEYVLYVVWHTKDVSPDFTAGDDIARIELSLTTSEDADSAKITVESD